MKVKLIQVTQNPIDIMWTAARTCYSAKSPIEMWDNRWDGMTECYPKTVEQHWNLVKKVLDSGHQSIAEHVYFTFAIEGISRACSHQLVRHRAGIVFSQQSQRYVTLHIENDNTINLNGTYINPKDDTNIKTHNYISSLYQLYKAPKNEEEKQQAFNRIKQIIDSLFILDTKNTLEYEYYFDVLNKYIYSIAYQHKKPEDARNILPNATKTNITMSVNYRELIHLCGLRLCTRAQKEIRDLFKEIVKCVKEVDERLASYLVPQCEQLGFCREKECCGRKPWIKDILNDTLSKDDWNLLMESIKNPQINFKLMKLLKEENIFDEDTTD